MNRAALVFLLIFLLQGCMEQKSVQRLEELSALKGKSSQHVIDVLGSPAVVDSSHSDNERIWGYYQVMVRSETDAKPRQRTVLIVLRKLDAKFVVQEVRIP